MVLYIHVVIDHIHRLGEFASLILWVRCVDESLAVLQATAALVSHRINGTAFNGCFHPLVDRVEVPECVVVHSFLPYHHQGFVCVGVHKKRSCV